MHIDLYVALAGLIVGFAVGMTGMGGGALMTPILVLLFKIQPLAAVSSDLVAAVVMKPVGAGVHMRRGTVNWTLVRWLCVGSVPAAFLGVVVLKNLGSGSQVQDRLKLILGVALILASTSIVLKSWLQSRTSRRAMARVDGKGNGNGNGNGSTAGGPPMRVKIVPTILIGALGGLVVGMTSVGSGSLIIVFLLLLYPSLTGKQLVGTDLVQAIPLVAAAALGHILFGDFKLSLTASVLVGSIPGVYIGAKLSSRAPDGVVRPALVFVLLASGLKLINMPTTELGLLLLALLLVGLPLLGIYDAAGRPDRHWDGAGQSKRRWISWQAAGAPFGVGFVAATLYFSKARPKLTAISHEEGVGL